ncbi:hypothetical protein C8R47DRAFT_1067485 [Mycena vitilis]|nr:hypothetical protein C8R47DRAFT_1067485 [Mycena vitilis]
MASHDQNSANKTNTCRELVLFAPLRWPPLSASLQKGEFWYEALLSSSLAVDGSYNNGELRLGSTSRIYISPTTSPANGIATGGIGMDIPSPPLDYSQACKQGGRIKSECRKAAVTTYGVIRRACGEFGGDLVTTGKWHRWRPMYGSFIHGINCLRRVFSPSGWRELRRSGYPSSKLCVPESEENQSIRVGTFFCRALVPGKAGLIETRTGASQKPPGTCGGRARSALKECGEFEE